MAYLMKDKERSSIKNALMQQYIGRKKAPFLAQSVEDRD
jgi:hypothetical protein